ncbi:MAG TPA: hypothetical protein VGQ53_14170 [Chitinophagaceae bacterium]|jgi:hypothetical protein|nr:hypothetical protein [Chitinophagaceae bacterium]
MIYDSGMALFGKSIMNSFRENAARFLILLTITSLASCKSELAKDELLGKWSYSINLDTFHLNFIDSAHCTFSSCRVNNVHYDYRFRFFPENELVTIILEKSAKQKDTAQLYLLRRLDKDRFKILLRGYSINYFSTELLAKSDSTNSGYLERELQ